MKYSELLKQIKNTGIYIESMKKNKLMELDPELFNINNEIIKKKKMITLANPYKEWLISKYGEQIGEFIEFCIYNNKTYDEWDNKYNNNSDSLRKLIFRNSEKYDASLKK